MFWAQSTARGYIRADFKEDTTPWRYNRISDLFLIVFSGHMRVKQESLNHKRMSDSQIKTQHSQEDTQPNQNSENNSNGSVFTDHWSKPFAATHQGLFKKVSTEKVHGKSLIYNHGTCHFMVQENLGEKRSTLVEMNMVEFLVTGEACKAIYCDLLKASKRKLPLTALGIWQRWP